MPLANDRSRAYSCSPLLPDSAVSIQGEQAMPRKARIAIPGVVYHVMLGYNREVVFAIEEEFQCYLETPRWTPYPRTEHDYPGMVE